MKITFPILKAILVLSVVALVTFGLYRVIPILKLFYVIAMFEAAPEPPQPEITYGEFPFRLVYELDGKEIVVEDIKICEYDGVISGSNGKHRKWKGYLASDSDNRNVFITADGTREIYCYIGSAEYYMNDEMYPEKQPLQPHVYNVMLNDNHGTMLSLEELLEKYKIKIISLETTPPIINTFK